MQRRRALIVDGYNVIRNNVRYAASGPDYNDDAWNHAREALINDAAFFAQGSYERCTVVFDGAGNLYSDGTPEQRAGIDVIFSPCGVSADSVIEKLAHDAREAGLEVVVVTSDSAVQSTVFGGGVTRMSAHGFGETSKALDEDWHDEVHAPQAKNTLAERIDPAVAAKLAAMFNPE